jgi:hypothetical protein
MGLITHVCAGHNGITGNNVSSRGTISSLDSKKEERGFTGSRKEREL